MRLTIVTTLYESAPHLEEFHRRIGAAVSRLTTDYEFIFVNDGSPDDSLAVARRLQKDDARLRIVDLSRNFGHHKAIITGLGYARGELVFLIDCDLEEPPELLPTFHDELERTGADVIYGVQKRRKGGWFERLSGALFYRVLNLLSSEHLPVNDTTVRLMRRRYVRSFIRHRDREVFLSGLYTITGYDQRPLVVDKRARGKSSYTLARRVDLAVQGITSFSNKPLLFVFYLGMAISSLALAAAAYLVVRRVFFAVYLTGWPSLIVSIWLLGGLTLVGLGVIGIYLAKVFSETKDRPYTVVRDVYEPVEGKRGDRV